MTYINVDQSNIENEHICCGFSDKKITESYESKKQWLQKEFSKGYVFRRIDERAKVFVEYGPAENAWVPVNAPDYMMIGCFWVSGKYKGHGHGKALLKEVIDDAKKQGKKGLVTVVGAKKFHFMSDTKWFLAQGFEVCETNPAGFSLISLDFDKEAKRPAFKKSAKSGECPEKKGLVVYYSNRCPFSEFHVIKSLAETVKKRKLKLTVVKLKTMKQAQSAPTPATIFSLFNNGKFVTTDISVCMDTRFDKIVGK